MCGFKDALSSVGINRSFEDDEILHLFEISWPTIEKKQPMVVNIYNGGSFLNDNELPYYIQRMIIKRFKESESVRTLLVESRPEFIKQGRLQEIAPITETKVLKIGIGLESATDTVRNSYINKGISKEDYENAVRIAKQSGIRVLTYILIKPLYMSEKDAISDAIDSAKYAFDIGSDEVSFEACCIQKGTRMEELYRRGQYTPPWLWSIIEVLRATHNLGNIQIGSFWDFPAPVAKPRNCRRCSKRVENLLNQYRIVHDISIFDNIDCRCKLEWRKSLEV